jgi:hypothetical protein
MVGCAEAGDGRGEAVALGTKEGSADDGVGVKGIGEEGIWARVAVRDGKGCAAGA